MLHLRRAKEKTFFELDKKEQKKQLNSVGKVLGNAPKRSLDAAKKASKKLMGKGINESENANQKRNSRLVKGSKEAIELGKKMREARESKSGQENTFGKTMGVYLQGYCILYL